LAVKGTGLNENVVTLSCVRTWIVQSYCLFDDAEWEERLYIETYTVNYNETSQYLQNYKLLLFDSN